MLISPLDLRIQPDHFMEIREMNLAARSSRQIMEHLAPAESAGESPDRKPPRLLLGGNGIRLEPWKVPDASRAEAAFVLFPNGSRKTGQGQIQPPVFPCPPASSDIRKREGKKPVQHTVNTRSGK